MSWVEQVFGKSSSEVTVHDIQRLSDDKVEENQNLEYKAPDILEKPEQLSQWTSAFLNAEGGLIIVGVREDDPNKKQRLNVKIYPVAIEFVAPKFTRERVDQLVYSNIRGDTTPQIAMFPVRNPQGESIFLLDVSQGDNPPYQEADGKYYRRRKYTKNDMRH